MNTSARSLDEIALSGTLPSPSGIGLAILELTRTEDYALAQLADTIQADPALTGRILKLANSSHAAAVQPVASIREAVMRLGVHTVRNLALGFTLVSANRAGRCAGFDYEGYWSQAFVAALAAQQLAPFYEQVNPADAFTCGLLATIGHLALASIHPGRFVHVLQEARERPLAERLKIERRWLDTDHCELGAALLEDWKLPQAFSQAVARFELGGPGEECEERTQQLGRLLRAAKSIAEAFVGSALDTQAAPGSRRWAGLADVALASELELEPFCSLLDRIAAAWEEWGRLLVLPTSKFPPFSGLVEHAMSKNSTDAGEPAGSEPGPATRKGLRILAVDDDPVSLKVLVHHLSRDGHSVTQAHNGRQALEQTLLEPPQLIVTDWMMPEMDGIEYCKALRLTPAGRGMYVLILTSREDEERVVEAFDAGADDYVVKPFNARILLARVRAGQRMIELREQVEMDRQQRALQLAEMAVLNRRLRAAALTDVLTDLPNRRYAMKRLEQELARSQRSGAPLSVMMLDIDFFKKVNDLYGHDVGDHVLRETASMLQSMTRRGDVVCRLGGEEFLVICSNCDLAEAARSAERIRAAIESHAISMAGADRGVTVSLGVAQRTAEIQDVDQLLKQADRRVYEAKARGRNRVVADGDAHFDRRSA